MKKNCDINRSINDHQMYIHFVAKYSFALTVYLGLGLLGIACFKHCNCFKHFLILSTLPHSVYHSSLASFYHFNQSLKSLSCLRFLFVVHHQCGTRLLFG